MQNCQDSTLNLTKRLFGLTAPVKRLLVISTLSSIFGNIGHMGLMGFGSALILSCAGALKTGNAYIWGFLMLVSAIMIAVLRMVEGNVSHRAAYILLAKMRVELFTCLRRLAPACLTGRNRGDIISIAISDIETIESFFAHTIGPLFTVILLPVITLFYAGTIDRLYVLALLPVYLIISVFLPLLSIRTGRSIGISYRTSIGELKSLILESVYGLKDIQIFCRGENRRETVLKKSGEVNSAAHALTLHKQIVTSTPTFFIYLSRIMIIAIATYLAITDKAEINRIIILSAIVSASFSSTQTLVSVTTNLLETYAAATRLFAIEDAVPSVVEKGTASDIEEIRDIRFEGVSFSYDANQNKILDNLDFTIHKGEKIGIIGASGIGKSTILRLLLRFWDADEGQILLNSTPITDVTLKSLRKRIALLEQQTFIFDDTIAANIAFGKPEASQEEIIKAAKRAGIHEFIQTLPNGYYTQMGEMGNRISGGERQRIGIARTMLMTPDVLVMDEPTSNLDVINEKSVLKTLDQEYCDKTLIIVSHRPSTLLCCGRIFKLENGKLTEQKDFDFDAVYEAEAIHY